MDRKVQEKNIFLKAVPCLYMVGVSAPGQMLRVFDICSTSPKACQRKDNTCKCSALLLFMNIKHACSEFCLYKGQSHSIQLSPVCTVNYLHWIMPVKWNCNIERVLGYLTLGLCCFPPAPGGFLSVHLAHPWWRQCLGVNSFSLG